MKNRDKVYPYCDHKCPLHESCSWYLEKINKSKNIHWGINPYNYKKNSCSWYVAKTIDELEQRVNDFLSPYNN